MDTVVGRRLQLDGERTKELSLWSHMIARIRKHFTALLPLEPLSCGLCSFSFCKTGVRAAYTPRIYDHQIEKIFQSFAQHHGLSEHGAIRTPCQLCFQHLKSTINLVTIVRFRSVGQHDKLKHLQEHLDNLPLPRYLLHGGHREDFGRCLRHQL